MFIVFEGPDGSGISTQANNLANRLEKSGLKIFRTAEPSQNILGKILREVLQKKQNLSPQAFQLLFFADREEHIQKEIIPAVQRGEIVICERFNWSSIAYGVAENIDQQFLENIAGSFIEPDQTFFMNLSPEESMRRIEKRGEIVEYFEVPEKLRIVQKIMIQLTESCRFTKKATQLDASLSIEKLSSQIDMILAPLLFAENFKG